MHSDVTWPEGKRFAFTIFDDTDWTNLTRGPDVYAFLRDLGMRTTKSVWTIEGSEPAIIGGSSCEDPEYLAWVLELQAAGFEIALHNAARSSSSRADVQRGLAAFREMFGHEPKIHVNHHVNRDGLYWGAARLTGANRLIYSLLNRGRGHGLDGGSDPSSAHFWGDLAKDRVTYVRNFVYADINTLKQCPDMPYHDPARPYVNNWFASSHGTNCREFCKTIAEANQDRLEEEGGACIMYTHFGLRSFREDGRLHKRFVTLMERLAAKGGWFVPVSELLDHLRARQTQPVITPARRTMLERKWLFEKVTVNRGSS